VRRSGINNEAKLDRGSALKQVGTCLSMQWQGTSCAYK
jgi:hypothetical protein